MLSCLQIDCSNMLPSTMWLQIALVCQCHPVPGSVVSCCRKLCCVMVPLWFTLCCVVLHHTVLRCALVGEGGVGMQ